MSILDKNTLKVLKFYNSHSQEMYSIASVAKFFPTISSKDMLEIVHYLSNNDYLRIVKDNLYQSTNKGKTYKSVARNDWISEHIIETLALIVAFVALIVSIIAILRTL